MKWKESLRLGVCHNSQEQLEDVGDHMGPSPPNAFSASRHAVAHILHLSTQNFNLIAHEFEKKKKNREKYFVSFIGPLQF